MPPEADCQFGYWSTHPHEFTGRLDRLCERCGQPDRVGVHQFDTFPPSTPPGELAEVTVNPRPLYNVPHVFTPNAGSDHCFCLRGKNAHVHVASEMNKEKELQELFQQAGPKYTHASYDAVDDSTALLMGILDKTVEVILSGDNAIAYVTNGSAEHLCGVLNGVQDLEDAISGGDGLESFADGTRQALKKFTVSKLRPGIRVVDLDQKDQNHGWYERKEPKNRLVCAIRIATFDTDEEVDAFFQAVGFFDPLDQQLEMYVVDTKKVSDAEAYEIYKDPKNRAPYKDPEKQRVSIASYHSIYVDSSASVTYAPIRADRDKAITLIRSYHSDENLFSFSDVVTPGPDPEPYGGGTNLDVVYQHAQGRHGRSLILWDGGGGYPFTRKDSKPDHVDLMTFKEFLDAQR